MKTAFIVLSFAEPRREFIKLLQYLKGFENGKIFLHHDYHQAPFSEELIQKYSIELVKPFYRTYWSHINNVKAMIAGLNVAYESGFDWYVMLTPNCYPIIGKKDLVSFFEKAKADAYIDMHRVNDLTLPQVDPFLLRDMRSRSFLRIPLIGLDGKLRFKTIRKKIPVKYNPFLNGRFEYYQGSNYFYLNRKAVEKIVAGDSDIHSLIDFYERYIKAAPDMHPCPQETIIQTFIANQANLRIENNSYRYIDWKNALNWSPNWLTDSHYEYVVNSNAHWIRKVRYPESENLLKIVDIIVNNECEDGDK